MRIIGNKLTVLLGLSLCAFSIDAFANNLKPFIAEYVAYRSGNDVGSAMLKLQSTNNEQYLLTYQSKVSRFFLSDKRFEKTLFSSEDNALVPITYEYKRTGTGPNKELYLDFNKQTNEVIVNNDKRMDWKGEFDNQLFRIDLPEKLALGMTKVNYEFINYRGEKREYNLEVVATESLTLPYGQLTAIKVKIKRESSSRITFAWFAPILGHNLVRLQQFKDDKEQGDIQLGKFSYL